MTHRRAVPVLLAGAAAAGEENDDQRRAEAAHDLARNCMCYGPGDTWAMGLATHGPLIHRTAFERTAPGAVARTRPVCLPMHARPAFVGKRRPSAESTAVAARDRLPVSVTDSTR